MGHIVNVSVGALHNPWWVDRANIVGFTVVIPGNNLDSALATQAWLGLYAVTYLNVIWHEIQNLLPPRVPQGITLP